MKLSVHHFPHLEFLGLPSDSVRKVFHKHYIFRDFVMSYLFVTKLINIFCF